jgi:alkylation response protein AidB-like acyl-CoA dehydrogenase
MDLRLNEDQEMFKKVAADFVQAEAPSTMLTQQFLKKETFLPDLYAKVAGLGWLGMLVPEQYGGAELSYMDCGVVFEELGRAPVPGPIFSSGVLSAQIVNEGGSQAQKESILAGICAGQFIVIPAIGDHGAHWGPETVETTLTQSGNNVVLQGTKRHVYDAEGATHFICVARAGDGKIALVLVDRGAKGVTVTPHVGFMVSVCEVSFEQVAVPAANLIGTVGAGWDILDGATERALPILCAYKGGACQEIYDFTVAYTNERKAFGQLIGRFQRVQDHCVELSVHMDAARAATYETLWKLDSGLPAAAGIHEAKAVSSEGYLQACNYSHMVHAGPGTDYLHPLMVHSVLAHTLYQYLGTPDYHKRRMVDAIVEAS